MNKKMESLDRAFELLQGNVTLESMYEWEHLASQASGEEASYLGEMYETFLFELSDEDYDKYMEELGAEAERKMNMDDDD
jgi:hypothetical protein